jgi:ATP-dependent Clp protease adaptor protein ClpS
VSESDTTTTIQTRTRIKPPSMWKVIFWNDDFTAMAFVVQVLMQIFDKNQDEATAIMLTVHEKSRATVGLYTKEIATTKVGITLRVAERSGYPLLATAEEA